jgi:hypothetical protein
MHCKSNFPLKKQKSNYDISLEVGTSDHEYLSQLSKALIDLEYELKNQIDFIFFQRYVILL